MVNMLAPGMGGRGGGEHVKHRFACAHISYLHIQNATILTIRAVSSRTITLTMHVNKWNKISMVHKIKKMDCSADIGCLHF